MVEGWFQKTIKELAKQHKIVTIPSKQLKDHIKPDTRGWLVVPCHYHSRIGTDISAAIRNFEVDNVPESVKVIVVVAHLVSKHALPCGAPTPYFIESEKYSKRGNIEYVDLFFANNEYYNCSLNEQGLNVLRNALKDYN